MSVRIGAFSLTTTNKRVAVSSAGNLRIEQLWVANTSAGTITLRLFHLTPGETAGAGNALIYDLQVRAGTQYQLLSALLPIDLGDRHELIARASASGLTLTIYRG